MQIAKSSNDLCCPSCLDIFNTPRYLPCRHTFCEKCLDDLIQMSVASYNKEVSFSCPVCRKKTLSPLPAISIDKWARHFPDDRILLTLLTDDRRQVKSLCSPCRMLGTMVHTTVFCTTCEKALCLNCRKSHESHSLVETSDRSSMPSSNVSLTFTSPCPVHTSREIEFICMSHDSMCCSDCVIDNHRRCTTLRIKDLSEELIPAKTSTDTIDHMKKLMGYLDCYIDRNEMAMKEVEMQASGMVSEIDKLISMLQEARSRVSKEFQDLMDKYTLIRSEDNRQCKSQRAALHNSLKILQTVAESGDKREIFITMYQIEDQLLHYEEAIQVQFSRVKYVKFKLKLDGSLLALQQLNTNQLAKIEAVETTLELELPTLEKTATDVRAKAADRANPRSPFIFGPAVQMFSGIFSFPKKDQTAVNKRSGANETGLVNMTSGEMLKRCIGTNSAVNTSEHATVIKATPAVKLNNIHNISDGNEHRYWGVVFLPSNRVLLIDRSHNQCRIFDSYTYNHLTDFDLKSEPFGACCVK